MQQAHVLRATNLKDNMDVGGYLALAVLVCCTCSYEYMLYVVPAVSIENATIDNHSRCSNVQICEVHR